MPFYGLTVEIILMKINFCRKSIETIVQFDGDILTIFGKLDARERAKKMVQDIISRF